MRDVVGVAVSDCRACMMCFICATSPVAGGDVREWTAPPAAVPHTRSRHRGVRDSACLPFFFVDPPVFTVLLRYFAICDVFSSERSCRETAGRSLLCMEKTGIENDFVSYSLSSCFDIKMIPCLLRNLVRIEFSELIGQHRM